MAINTFPSAPQRDGQKYWSQINFTDLITVAGGDTYFDIAAKFFRVDIVYVEPSDERQQVRIQHYPSRGTVSFTSTAKPGTWEKSFVKMYDHDGATKTVNRAGIIAALGSVTDLVLA